MKNNIQDQEVFNEISKLLTWNKWLLSMLGLWPDSPNNFIFAINFGYFFYHMILEYLDLFFFIDDLEHVVENLTENMAFTEILVRLAMLKKYNYQLGDVISEASTDYDLKIYRTHEEQQAFINYMSKAKTIVKIMCIVVTITATSHFFTPILNALFTQDMSNSTMPFVLPYRFYLFYEVNDFQTYVLTYASHFPFVFVSGFGQTAADCLMVTLVFHVSGKLAALAIRIAAMKTDPQSCKKEFDEIIVEHERLLKMGKSIEEAYSEILLVHLLAATAAVCFLSFQLLSNFAKGNNTDLGGHIAFIFLVFFILYAICLVGENLIEESRNVCDAFYNCDWYNMPQEVSKTLILCLARSQKSLKLSAGKFTIFCLTTFIDTIKTAMAYLSILRTFLIIE